MHEVHAIRQRMERGLREKASRGELHHGVPPGYVCVEAKHLVKHPDRRVRGALARVFRDFPSHPSAYALAHALWAQGVKLPRVPRGGDGQEVEWVEPDPRRVLEMLRNPKYAGIYVHGRRRTLTEMTPTGEVRKRVVCVAQGDWQTVIYDNHPAYLTVEEYDRNQKKIAMNASQSGNRVKTAAQKGPGLAVGLLRCRRCGHKLGVRYSGNGAIRYYCRQGLPQRGTPTGNCLRFVANELESQLVESILYAISPAGVEAAELAAQKLSDERERSRQRLADAVEDCRYKANLARRRLDKVDPDHRLVFDTLTEEWERALRTLKEEEARLEAFDRDGPQVPTPEQRRELQRLGEDVQQAWFHPRADLTIKKEIVRTVIEEIVVDLDDSAEEIVWLVHWAGGHHTELRAARESHWVSSRAKDLKPVLDTLRKVYDDEGIARILNRASIKTERGGNWTKSRVMNFRERHDIPAYSAKMKQEQAWLTQQEAATYLEVSPMSVHRLITRQILPAEHHPGLPTVIRREDLDREELKRAARGIRNHGNSPLPENPNQLSLFDTTAG